MQSEIISIFLLENVDLIRIVIFNNKKIELQFITSNHLSLVLSHEMSVLTSQRQPTGSTPPSRRVNN